MEQVRHGPPPSEILAALERHAAWGRGNTGNPEVLAGLRLAGVAFPSNVLRELTFEDCVLDQCSFADVGLPNVRFVRTELRSCVLRGLDAVGAELRESRLLDCDLEGAVFDNALIIDSRVVRCRAAAIVGVDLSATRTEFSETTLEGARLKSAFFHGCRLDGVNLSEADLSFAGFGESSLSRVRLQGTVVGRTSFTDGELADLTGRPAESPGATFAVSCRAVDVQTGEKLTRTFDYDEWCKFMDSLWS